MMQIQNLNGVCTSNINEAENVFQWRSPNEGLYSFFDVIKQTLQWSHSDHSSVHTNLMELRASAVMWLTGGLHAMRFSTVCGIVIEIRLQGEVEPLLISMVLSRFLMSTATDQEFLYHQ